MLIIPAIDLMNGECVRLTRGDFASKKVYGSDPIRIAQEFERQGAPMIHVVDLDGARDGTPRNLEIILKLQKSVHVPLEVGGGIRRLQTVVKYLDSGISRIVLGTVAMEDHAFLEACLKTFDPSRIVIGVDAKDGMIASHGWLNVRSKSFLDFTKEIQRLGITEIVYTDISRDGTLSEPNFDGLRRLIRMGLHVVASGGISDLESLKRLQAMGAYGAILGKALYEKKITVPEALAIVKPPSNLAKRIIPCLDVKDGRVVKGVHFLNLRDAGDPVALGERYSKEDADELVFLDITASLEHRETVFNMVSEVAKHVFIPFTVGGGLRTIDEIRRILHSGADKVSLNTAAVENPSLVTEASKAFGSQCIVVAIDVKKIGKNYKVFVKGGHEETALEAVSWAKKVEKLGAGEILLTSMDRDGTKKGFDLEILRKISDSVNIPVIASGGAGSLADLKEAFTIGHADAVLAASLFHQKELSIKEVKAYLKAEGIPVRK